MDDSYLTVASYFGPIVVPNNDIRIGREIQQLGHWEFEELIEIMRIFDRYYQNPIGAFVDVGCNVGSFMLPLSRRFKNSIIGFDCQSLLVDAANKTFELNQVDNARAFCYAVSDTIENIEVPSINYNYGANFGSYEMEPPFQNSDTNVKCQQDRVIAVSVSKLDKLVNQDVSFIKIDVEGMEHKVINGATNLLEQSRPFVVLENHKTDFDFVKKTLLAFDYINYTTVREMTVFIPKEKQIQ